MNRSGGPVSDHLIGPLLQSVSRSFYLSIRVLPAHLGQPVGLAYLLARATDTVADTSEIAPEVRQPRLELLASIIQGGAPVAKVNEVISSFAPLQTNAEERKLIESLPQCLEALDRLETADRKDVRVLLEKINNAQRLDIERFGKPGTIRALATEDELNEYTYLIAGCVGEFWTNVSVRHVRNFATLSVDQMLDLGRHYGAGLQLINILRDAGGDLRAGRCYFPDQDLSRVGLTPEKIPDQPGKFMPVFNKWLDRAAKGLEAGMQYSLAVRNRRVRGATALPALIGARTIALLREAGDAVLEEKVKVPRTEVRSLLRRVGMTLSSKATLQRLYRNASR
jgi:farnesyl-diphosphate farnesyltransferase